MELISTIWFEYLRSLEYLISHVLFVFQKMVAWIPKNSSMSILANSLYNSTNAERTRFDMGFYTNITEESGNVHNLTTFCHADYVPSVEEYFTGTTFTSLALVRRLLIATAQSIESMPPVLSWIKAVYLKEEAVTTG